MTSDSSNTKISGDVQANLKRLGKYEIVRKIGSGGMGTVYLAQDKHLNRTVALKVLPKDRAENPILVRRFQSEARASAMLTHDNIVSVFDADEADGYLYIALEYIDGIDLFEWLRKREQLPVKRSIDIIKQVSAALQHAHEKNLVHRDIKPANIMITREGLVKLADMGLARSIDESLDTTITRDGTTVGTVDYMSPEQAANSKNTDIRSDIYSLGCTWYHMLTGEPPFPKGSMTNKLTAHAKTPPPDPRDYNENVTEAIVAIIHRMMSKKKVDRYQTPAELLEDLNNSTNLESNSGNLLAMLLAEDEFEDEAGEDPEVSASFEDEDILDKASAEFEVQEEPQADLNKKPQKKLTAETNPQPPIPQKLKQKKKKPVLPPQVERSSSVAEVSEVSEAPRSERKPLRRVHSREELDESNASSSPKQSSSRNKKSTQSKPAELPKKQKVKASKERRSKSGNQKPTKSQKPQASNRKTQRPQSNKDEALKPQNQQSGQGVDIDWGRAGIVILIVGLLIIGAWWGASNFGGGDSLPDQNPYGENAEESSVTDQASTANNDPLMAENEEPAEDVRPDVVEVIDQPEVEPIVENDQTPEWIVAGWAKPKNEELKIFTVQRGTQRSNAFRSLESALAKVDEKTGDIDLSQLTHARLAHVELKLKETLRISSSNSQPILTFNTSKKNEPSAPWLSVSGGTLELQGLNFVVTNQNSRPVDFLRLQGTDLILRDCTFTAIGDQPVNFIGVHGESQNSNRIYIANSLFRGENISGIQVDQVPCDLYCENALFASQKNQLLQIEQNAKPVTQKVLVNNCTFVGGNAALALKNSSQSERQSEIALSLNRSLFVGAAQAPSTGLLLQNQNFSSTETHQRPQHLSLKLLHTRFVNIEQLVKAESLKGDALIIADTPEWNRFWSSTLPSDDLLSSQELDSLTKSPMALTATALDSKIQTISRPGVGERSLIGVDSSHVASVEQAAIERQIAMNYFEEVHSSFEPLQWSDKTVRFDLNEGAKLNSFLNSDQCPDGTTVVCFGAGIRKISPVTLKERKLRLTFEQSAGTLLSVVALSDTTTAPMFRVEGGVLAIEGGPIQIAKPRAEQDGTMFLHTSNGARVQLLRTHVSAPLSASGANQLIFCAPNPNANQPNIIEIKETMLTGSGSLLKVHLANQNLVVENSILVARDQVMSVTGATQPGMILLKQSTLSAGRAIIDCRGSQSPIQTLAIDSVFAPPLHSSEKNSLISGDSRQSIQQTLNWWESACAYSSQISTPIQIGDDAIPGTFENAWNRFWGPHHIYDPLTGPQAVVFRKDFTELKNLQPADLQLQQTGLSATWGTNGTPIGANIETIGPQASGKKPATQNQPRKVNTPSGF
jgi:eukaryotic-like serine/threonine-protein kinase